MKKLIILLTLTFGINEMNAQMPCSKPSYRQFDFWLGEWEAFGPKGAKAGDSKISVILNKCTILEEWTSANAQQGLVYAGKSFNSYNDATKQWQQTWIDNTGATTEYLRGEGSDGQIVFYADKVAGNGGKFFMRRLTFTKLSNDKVKQFGERSDDGGNTWTTEYDLEYRRKETNPQAIADTLLKKMEIAYNSGQFEKIADYYHTKGKIVGRNETINGRAEIINYWKGFSSLAGNWKLTTAKAEINGDLIWQKGLSIIKDSDNKEHKVTFTLVLAKENNEWKILQDAYW